LEEPPTSQTVKTAQPREILQKGGRAESPAGRLKQSHRPAETKKRNKETPPIGKQKSRWNETAQDSSVFESVISKVPCFRTIGKILEPFRTTGVQGFGEGQDSQTDPTRLGGGGGVKGKLSEGAFNRSIERKRRVRRGPDVTKWIAEKSNEKGGG